MNVIECNVIKNNIIYIYIKYNIYKTKHDRIQNEKKKERT